MAAMTQRRRVALAVGGALGLNGLLLGALSLDYGRGPPALEAEGPLDPAIWLSLAPQPVDHSFARPAEADADAPLISDPPSSPLAPQTDKEVSDADRAALEPVPLTTTVSPDLRARIARSLRARLACSPSHDGLSAAEVDLCEDRMGRDADPISGSGDAQRDRRLDRQGARQLETYAARRQRPGGAVRPTCEDAGPVSDCGVDVSIEIFSSIDGFFPGLRRDDD